MKNIKKTPKYKVYVGHKTEETEHSDGEIEYDLEGTYSNKETAEECENQLYKNGAYTTKIEIVHE